MLQINGIIVQLASKMLHHPTFVDSGFILKEKNGNTKVVAQA